VQLRPRGNVSRCVENASLLRYADDRAKSEEHAMKRRRIEWELIEDAAAHGRQREVERHSWTVKRIEQLLAIVVNLLIGQRQTIKMEGRGVFL